MANNTYTLTEVCSVHAKRPSLCVHWQVLDISRYSTLPIEWLLCCPVGSKMV